MSAIITIQEQELMQLAKAQLRDFEMITLITSLGSDAELRLHMQTTAAGVIDSIAEGVNPFQKETFRKNFLVIAKSYNAEYRLLLSQCLENEYVSLNQYDQHYQINRSLQDKLVSLIEDLQHSGKRTPENT
jgi:hypothetical protein